jgi:hypothetical protein
MEGANFLNYVWSLQPNGFFFLARRRGKLWQELPIDRSNGGKVKLKMPTTGDLYFCPNAFSSPQRVKGSCLESRVMYQDLDESDPRQLPILPELYWETSSQRYQALWVLDQSIDPLELAQLNRALNRASHADPGTWNLTRLLRVPGSWNGKRNCRVSGAYSSIEAVA